jgi:hypothetical protein
MAVEPFEEAVAEGRRALYVTHALEEGVVATPGVPSWEPWRKS